MAGITAEQAQTRLDEYMAAESAVLAGQSYSIGGRSVTKANLKEIRDGISYWTRQATRLDRGGIKVRGATIV